MPMRKGSQHSTAAKEKISRKLKGKKQRADHVEKRAAAQRGTKRGPMSEEHKAAIRAGRARSC